MFLGLVELDIILDEEVLGSIIESDDSRIFGQLLLQKLLQLGHILELPLQLLVLDVFFIL